jgi:dihydroorotate dehydrogenase electron transfer subunit
VEIALKGWFLRRPLSVCDYDGQSLTLIYKVVGQGTEAMTHLVPGDRLDLLCGLGNGFDPSLAGERPLVVGGGVGVPPLYGLVRELVKLGRTPDVVLGFNKAEEVFYAREFAALGARVTVTTVDGSLGVRGFVTAALPEGSSHVFACGPMPLLRLYKAPGTYRAVQSEETHGLLFASSAGRCSIMKRRQPPGMQGRAIFLIGGVWMARSEA